MIKIGAQILALVVGATATWAYTEGDCQNSADRALAVRACTEIINRNPNAVTAYGSRGYAYLALGKEDLAIADFTRAIELNPRDAHVYAMRAHGYQVKGAHDLTIADYTRAIAIDPKSSLAYDGRGFAYAGKEEYDRAIRDYNRAVELDPKNALAFANRGEAYLNQGDKNRAIADATKAIELNHPRLLVPFGTRGRAHLVNGEYDRAIANSNRAIKIDPKFSLSYTTRGAAYAKKGDYDRAISDLNKAIELDPRGVRAYVLRGFAYESKGDSNRALSDYRKTLTLPARSSGDREFHHIAQRTLTSWGIAAPIPPTAALPPPTPMPKRQPENAVSGTGVVVSSDGMILTNAHVVRDCAGIRVNSVASASAAARLVAADHTNDLALLKAAVVSTIRPPPFRRGARVGESVFAYGFPLAGYLPTSGNFTSGNITGRISKPEFDNACANQVFKDQGKKG